MTYVILVMQNYFKFEINWLVFSCSGTDENFHSKILTLNIKTLKIGEGYFRDEKNSFFFRLYVTDRWQGEIKFRENANRIFRL